MSDKSWSLPIGHQIRALRQRRGMTLAELARRAGTSAPALHRYEHGWDRFEMKTLRGIASALGARLDVRLVPAAAPQESRRRPTAGTLLRRLASLSWDRDLEVTDFERHPGWVLERVLVFGDREQVRAARAYFGDDAVRKALRRKGIDPRTRHYWRLVLDEPRAP